MTDVSCSCPTCGADWVAQTDGNGCALLLCLRCGRTEVVRPHPPPGAPERRVAAPACPAPILRPRQLRAMVARLRRGESSVTAEARRLGYTGEGELRRLLRRKLGVEQYAALIAAGRKNRQRATR